MTLQPLSQFYEPEWEIIYHSGSFSNSSLKQQVNYLFKTGFELIQIVTMSIINKNDKYLDYQDHMAENLAIGVVILVLVDEVVAQVYLVIF